MIPRSQNVFLEGIRLVRAFGESRDLVFSPSRSNLGLVSSRWAGFVRNREIYNLGMVSWPVLLKIKGKSWIFIFWGSKQRKIKKKWRNRSNVGLRSSRWYQKDAEGRRGYFRKIWAWKTLKKQGQIKNISGFSQFSRGFRLKPVNSRTNGWGPYIARTGYPGLAKFSDFFLFFWPQKHENPTFSLYF